MLNLKPNINVKNNSMSSIYIRNYNNITVQIDGSTVDSSVYDLHYIPNILVTIFCFTNSIEIKCVLAFQHRSNHFNVQLSVIK
jgi:Na+/H+ antiporter NhaA